MYSLLQLFQSYDSNKFNTLIYEISKEILEKDLEIIQSTFDEKIMKIISDKHNREINNVFTDSESLFKSTGVGLGLTFKHYFFARIEQFLDEGINLQMQETFENLMKTRIINQIKILNLLEKNII